MPCRSATFGYFLSVPKGAGADERIELPTFGLQNRAAHPRAMAKTSIYQTGALPTLCHPCRAKFGRLTSAGVKYSR